MLRLALEAAEQFRDANDFDLHALRTNLFDSLQQLRHAVAAADQP